VGAEILLSHSQEIAADTYPGWVLESVSSHFNIILLFRHRSANQPLAFRFSYYNFYTLVRLPFLLLSCPTSSSFIWKSQVIKFLSERPWLQASAAMLLNTALFSGITQRRVVIIYRRFGTTYPSHLQGSRSPRRIPFLDFLTPQDGTDRLFQNVYKGLRLDAALYPSRAQFSSVSNLNRCSISNCQRYLLGWATLTF
jgi:hypothetical protein